MLVAAEGVCIYVWSSTLSVKHGVAPPICMLRSRVTDSPLDWTREDLLDVRGKYLPGSPSKTGVDSSGVCPWDVAGLGCPMWLARRALESLMLATWGYSLLSLREDRRADELYIHI